MNVSGSLVDLSSSLTPASLLFGFLFAGFWWALDRELKFPPEERHFKFGCLLLLLTMIIVALFGIIVPLWHLSKQNNVYTLPFRAVSVSILGVFGYMLTEFGHYSIFQRPKYTTWQEHFFFWSSLLALGVGVVWNLVVL